MTILLFLAGIGFLYKAAHNPDPLADVLIAFLLLGLGGLSIAGFFTAQPNQGVVLILFGNYVGTVRTSGWSWTNPFITRKKISLRARSLNGERIKVNDQHGNPVEIAAVVVWKVRDTAQATFDVDDYERFVTVTRLSHLAYAPEIAQAMLQRQQAGAIIAARTRIVEGAVGMVEMALDRLGKNHIVELDEERKAAMVSNLLVVLCGEHAATPVLNAGTLYK
ncbi:MAG: SPFH domain-containing protein [Candidatus Eisenbacteria bacterium]|uniref:SPFH domain-containing protein n=1 Tax=Eiseniibacteriota bacterium TaxID=2212470 RepID=A0A538SAD4_UNCEI|nr:MAG: SPFH domain-containing protein [Candidatus Eisenbacteria bacterium]